MRKSAMHELLPELVNAAFATLAEIEEGEEVCTAALWQAVVPEELRGPICERMLFDFDYQIRRQAKRRGWLLDGSMHDGLSLGHPWNIGFVVIRLPITKVEYSEGGYFGRPVSFVIDAKARTFVCAEGRPGGGELSWFPCHRISTPDGTRFDSLFRDCQFMSWDEDYVDPEVHDGTQWELKIKSGRRVLRKIYGSNSWPNQWEKVVDLLKFCQCEVELDPSFNDDDFSR